jgi:hypothetical protein
MTKLFFCSFSLSCAYVYSFSCASDRSPVLTPLWLLPEARTLGVMASSLLTLATFLVFLFVLTSDVLHAWRPRAVALLPAAATGVAVPVVVAVTNAALRRHVAARTREAVAAVRRWAARRSASVAPEC